MARSSKVARPAPGVMLAVARFGAAWPERRQNEAPQVSPGLPRVAAEAEAEAAEQSVPV